MNRLSELWLSSLLVALAGRRPPTPIPRSSSCPARWPSGTEAAKPHLIKVEVTPQKALK